MLTFSLEFYIIKPVKKKYTSEKYQIIHTHTGFTLAELLIVVAIIGVLVAISIPVFSNQLGKSREVTDIANVRSAYAEVMTAAINEDTENTVKVVKLKQKQSGWQFMDPITIGEITHYKSEGDTINWEGNPGANGECIVQFIPDTGIKFIWSGDTNNSSVNINFDEDVHGAVQATGYPQKNTNNSGFEIDSKCPSSDMAKEVKKRLVSNSLLQYGTWAYLADLRPSNKVACIFWTSVDTNATGAGVKIPVIVSKEGGGYYIAESTTALRKNKQGDYVAIADHLPNYSYFKPYTSGTKYDTLDEAYKAYTDLVKTKYTQYESTLPG